MIAIVNISPEDSPLYGIDTYELRVNREVLCTFKHDRQVNNLSQCLRDAADAHDKYQDNLAMKLRDILTLHQGELQ